MHSEHEIFLLAIENFSEKGTTDREPRFIYKNENALFEKCMENDKSLFASNYFLVRNISIALEPISPGADYVRAEVGDLKSRVPMQVLKHCAQLTYILNL